MKKILLVALVALAGCDGDDVCRAGDDKDYSNGAIIPVDGTKKLQQCVIMNGKANWNLVNQ